MEDNILNLYKESKTIYAMPRYISKYQIIYVILKCSTRNLLISHHFENNKLPNCMYLYYFIVRTKHYVIIDINSRGAALIQKLM